MWDKHSGNKSGTPTFGYCTLFRDLPGVYERHMDQNLIKMESPLALWCSQMVHQTKTHTSDCGRLLVTGNLYKRHKMDKQLLKLTEGGGGWARMLGTASMNIVDAVNRPDLKKV